MVEIVRPGIDPVWERSWKRVLRGNQKTVDSHQSTFDAQLEEYARHGFISAERETRSKYAWHPIDPPYLTWESSYLDGLMTQGRAHPLRLEKMGMEGIFDVEAAGNAFAASYTGQMIQFNRHEKYPKRFPGRTLQALFLGATVFTALGVVIGCEKEAHRLARMQLAAFRKGYFGDTRFYPIYNFVLRVLADYLKEPPLRLEGDALHEPIFNALFKVWRHPDPGALSHILLAACDFHTHRCKTGRGKHFYEFENGDWTRTPFEILLVFKLRQKLGLENPQLDHPLMNTALGVLPPEVPFQPDELVARVRARMAQDGYDEDAIYAAVTA